jgi:hypothetical protein
VPPADIPSGEILSRIAPGVMMCNIASMIESILLKVVESRLPQLRRAGPVSGQYCGASRHTSGHCSTWFDVTLI